MKNHQTKSELHPRNRNRTRYDLISLVQAMPELGDYVQPNKRGEDSIDFSNPLAVKLLNRALLHHYYGITHWDFPDKNLCPPIPGRAEYIHHIADLLADSHEGTAPKGSEVTCVDIGTGASCIYPIIGVVEYGWQFIATDVDPASIASAENIIRQNPALKGKIACRLQQNPAAIFRGILKKTDHVELTICNPPFHASLAAAKKGSQRKVRNLSGKKTKEPILNFSGNHRELVYPGGERQFILTMIRESRSYARQCRIFSSLVSSEANLKPVYAALKKTPVTWTKTIEMGTGNKRSRIVAWSFMG